MGDEDLYRSANLVVRAAPGTDAACWVVTFDHFTESPDFGRPGFGEGFMRAQGWSAIHVLGSGNDWYHYEDLPAALAAVRAYLAGATRVVTYGSSMGAYAALRFADAVGADGVLALSPQYSNDPQIVPWERRWLDDGFRIPWQRLPSRSLSRRTPAFVLFDPADTDRRHAVRIAAETDCTLIPLPHAGHPVTTLLGELHLLGSLLADVRAGCFEPAAFQPLVRQRRRESTVYLCHLALAQPACRPILALRLVEMARELAPGSSLAMQHLATIHRRAGRHDAAIATLERAVEATSRRDINHLYALADAMRDAGRVLEAVDRMAEAIVLAPGLAHLRAWQARALLEAGLLREAVRMQASAVALAPTRRIYRTRLRKYRAKLLVHRAVGLLTRPVRRLVTGPTTALR